MFTMKKILLLLLLIISIISCAQTFSYIRTEQFIGKESTIVIASFTLPKNMTNPNLDKLKYLNTQMYVDDILSAFITNFNKQGNMIKLITLEEALGTEEFSKLEYHSVLGSSTVAATGTIATNYLTPKTISLLEEKTSGYMFVESILSFWSQKVELYFQMYDFNESPIWIEEFEGTSYHIIGDTGPTRQTAYDIIIADILEYQKKHKPELDIVIDEAVSNAVISLKDRNPYIFSTNDILFTEKTFSLTNENYKKKAGIK